MHKVLFLLWVYTNNSKPFTVSTDVLILFVWPKLPNICMTKITSRVILFYFQSDEKCQPLIVNNIAYFINIYNIKQQWR